MDGPLSGDLPAHLTFDLDRPRGLVLVAGLGDARAEDWIDLFHRVFVASGYQPGMDFLIDCRRITTIPTLATITAIVDFYRQIVDYYSTYPQELQPCQLAWVTHEDAAHGRNRMGSVQAESTSVTVRVFRDPSSAYAWLRPEIEMLERGSG